MERPIPIKLYEPEAAKEYHKIIKKKYSFFSPERRMARAIEKKAKRIAGTDIWGRIMSKIMRPHERVVITEEGEEYIRRHRPIFSRIRTEEDRLAYYLQTGKEKKIGQFAWGFFLDRGHDKLRNEIINKLWEKRLTEIIEQHQIEREKLMNKIKELEEKLKAKEKVKSKTTSKPKTPVSKKSKTRRKKSKKRVKKASPKSKVKSGIVLSKDEMEKLKKIVGHKGYLENLDAKHFNEARKILENHRDKLLTPAEMIEIEAMRNAIDLLSSRLDSHKEPTYLATKTARAKMFSSVRRLYKKGLTDVLGKKIAGGQAREIEEKTGLKLPKNVTEMRELDRVVHEIFRGGRTGGEKELRELVRRASNLLYRGETKLLAKRLLKKVKPRK